MYMLGAWCLYTYSIFALGSTAIYYHLGTIEKFVNLCSFIKCHILAQFLFSRQMSSR
jgi:hypothetical protein